MALLNRAEYGILSVIAENRKPYGVPVNYCVIDHGIYFHCAVEGRIVDSIRNNKSVSFCVVGKTEILPDQFGTKYESAIASGDVEEIVGEKKQLGLEGLLLKYSPEFMDKGKAYIEKLNEKTRVFMISIDRLTGKARNK